MVVKWTILVEEMAKTIQDLQEQVKFLERRINLIEKVNDFQDEELDKLWERTNNEKHK